MRAKKKNAWHCDPSTCEPRSIWSRQWCHSILSFFFDSLKSGYGPISENEIDSKSFNSQVIEALVCLNLLAGNLICWGPLKSKQPIDHSVEPIALGIVEDFSFLEIEGQDGVRTVFLHPVYLAEAGTISSYALNLTTLTPGWASNWMQSTWPTP